MTGRIFLGRYELGKLLGEGGMGRVYLARQADLNRQVVVKVMHDHIAADPKFRERFQRETLLMARFQHPYVVALYDASLNDPAGPCIVMEYIKGITLDVLLHRNGRLSAGRVSRILTQLCEALQAAHAEGIVHRDLKPANLMIVDPDTPYEKIKVMDFGLAKMFGDDHGMGMYHKSTETGADFAVGTPGYISPEQVRGEEVGHRSDLYSVGVILYELLSGKLPFHREETMDVLIAHATEPPPPFEQNGLPPNTIPAAVERVVLGCLAKNASQRPASARDLAQMFEQAIFEEEDRAAHEALSASAATMGLASSSIGKSNSAQNPASAKNPAGDTHIDLPMIPGTRKFDPTSMVFQMEAYMPDALALYKLRGFAQDMNGEVIDSQPGLIRMRLDDAVGKSWNPFRKRSIVDMALYLDRIGPSQQNLLHVTVVMTSPDGKSSTSAPWRDRCSQVYVELRSYLAGITIANTAT
jgi:eukaryotic-like serine/threonine-protein kinase